MIRAKLVKESINTPINRDIPEDLINIDQELEDFLRVELNNDNIEVLDLERHMDSDYLVDMTISGLNQPRREGRELNWNVRTKINNFFEENTNWLLADTWINSERGYYGIQIYNKDMV